MISFRLKLGFKLENSLNPTLYNLVAKKEATGTSYNQRSVAECSATESDTDTSGIEKDSLEDFSARSSFPVESVRYSLVYYSEREGILDCKLHWYPCYLIC